jgi:putative ABC transport system permease protein
MWRITLANLVAHRRRLVTTGLAVLLGVAFLAGTLVLSHTVSAGYSSAIADATSGTDALVRSSVRRGREENAVRGLIDGSLAEVIAGVDGVAAVAPVIEGSGRIAGADGDPVGGDGATVVGNWIDDSRLNPYALAAGRAPAAPGEAVIDVAAAEEGGLSVGDTTTLRLPDLVEVTVVGLVTFGGADSRGASTYAALTTAFAREVLPSGEAGRSGGKVAAVAVAAGRGVDPSALVRRLEAVLPADGSVEAVTRSELAREIELEIQGDDQESFQRIMTAFAVLALVVAGFTTYNTLSILVAQRTRESALLRALGASRRQVLGSVAGEAVVVGLVASSGGVVVGAGLAWGLLALMDAIGLATPVSSPALDVSTTVTALVVGVGATLVASVAPAVRASRVPPVAAMGDAAVDRSATSRSRVAVGVVLAGGGIALGVAGGVTQALDLAGLGTLATVVGAVVVGPVVARPAAMVLGAPFARWRGTTGTLAQDNAMRNPRRTAGTAAPLMIGLAIVALFTVVAASLKQSIADAVDDQFAGDLVIVGEGRGGVSTSLAGAIASLPEVAVASPTGGASVRIDGRDTLAPTFDPATVSAVLSLDVDEGSLQMVGADQLAISRDYALAYGLGLGSAVTVDYPDGAAVRATVGAIYSGDNLSEDGGGVRLPRSAALAHTARAADTNVMIALAAGVSVEDGERAVQRVADRFGAPDVETNDEVSAAIGAEIDALLTVVYALLALAIVIALLGIATTLSLSIHERRHELSLLRAIGQTRSQARATLRTEVLIVALLGTLAGLALGLFLAWTLVTALHDEGFTTFVIPPLPLTLLLVLTPLAALTTTLHPTRTATTTPLPTTTPPPHLSPMTAAVGGLAGGAKAQRRNSRASRMGVSALGPRRWATRSKAAGCELRRRSQRFRASTAWSEPSRWRRRKASHIDRSSL